MAQAPYGVAGMADYSREINEIDNLYGLIQQRGYFTMEPISSTVALIDKVGDTLTILPTTNRGGPATQATNETRQILPLIVPHIPYDDYLTPEDVQDRRAPGDIGPDTIERNRLKKVKKLRQSHALTREYMRLGAIKGNIVDGNGNTLYNLYTEFGVAQTTIDFELDDTSTDVKKKCRDVRRFVKNNLKNGGMITGIDILCSAGFFDKLTNHPDVVEAFQFYAASAGQRDPNRVDTSDGFMFQGLNFIEYDGSVKLLNGTTPDLIADGEAHVVPLGVDDLFVDYMAPANHLDYVNTDGLELYLWEIPSLDGSNIRLKSESNPLPICRRPGGLPKLIAF